MHHLLQQPHDSIENDGLRFPIDTTAGCMKKYLDDMKEKFDINIET